MISKERYKKRKGRMRAKEQHEEQEGGAGAAYEDTIKCLSWMPPKQSGPPTTPITNAPVGFT
eukprot:761926-Hanusia_phi.AAC.1